MSDNGIIILTKIRRVAAEPKTGSQTRKGVIDMTGAFAIRKAIAAVEQLNKMENGAARDEFEKHILAEMNAVGINWEALGEDKLEGLGKKIEYIRQTIKNREEGHYWKDDAAHEDKFAEGKSFWCANAETPAGHECIVTYAFDDAKFGKDAKDKYDWDDPENVYEIVTCSNWK